MINNKTIAVVVPSYNEENQISEVIYSMPKFVDRIVIVNDFSKDRTAKLVEKIIDLDNADYANSPIGFRKIVPSRYNEAEVILQEVQAKEAKYFTPCEIYNKNPEKSRIILINHLQNRGVGAAIATGYKWCYDNNIDCSAVMAGDGQMDPDELESICSPVIDEGVDYVKGNRLTHRSAKYVIPKKRFFGNSVLSILTKLASGYWRVSDTQTGYTAISLKALKALDLFKIYPKYGMPNDMLVKLNIASCTLREVEIKPVYRIGEQSKMNIKKVIFKISWLLFISFFKRMWKKYFVRDFHPLFLFYMIGIFLGICSVPFMIQIGCNLLTPNVTPESILIIFIFLFISAFQSFLFAMWMDIQDNERLYK